MVWAIFYRKKTSSHPGVASRALTRTPFLNFRFFVVFDRFLFPFSRQINGFCHSTGPPGTLHWNSPEFTGIPRISAAPNLPTSTGFHPRPFFTASARLRAPGRDKHYDEGRKEKENQRERRLLADARELCLFFYNSQASRGAGGRLIVKTLEAPAKSR